MKKLHYACTILLASALVLIGCSKDDKDDNTGGEPLSQTELKSILETDEISASVDMVLAELYQNDNSTAKGSNECYEAIYSDTGFSATFNNCVLNGSDNINGTLEVVYETGTQSAVFTATFSDFYIGEIKVNGTRTYSINGGSGQNSVEFSVTSDIELLYPDDSLIAEAGTKTVVFTFGETLESSTLAISGNWILEMDGNTYIVEVTEDLLGNFSCDDLVSGLLYVGKNGLAVTIDFGDGSCDDLATIEYPDGTTQDITLED